MNNQKNKSYRLAAVALTSLLVSLNAGASEHGVGNGGLAAVCRNQAGVAVSARLLDILEAEHDGLIVVQSSQPWRTQFKNAFGKVGRAIVSNSASYILQKTKIKPTSNPSWGLPDPKDYNPRVYLKHCPYEVLGSYHDETNTLEVDSEIFPLLSETEKAAFYAHEVSYKAARINSTGGEVTSDKPRLLVGKLFSSSTSSNELNEIISSNEYFGIGVLCDGSFNEQHLNWRSFLKTSSGELAHDRWTNANIAEPYGFVVTQGTAQIGADNRSYMITTEVQLILNGVATDQTLVVVSGVNKIDSYMVAPRGRGLAYTRTYYFDNIPSWAVNSCSSIFSEM